VRRSIRLEWLLDPLLNLSTFNCEKGSEGLGLDLRIMEEELRIFNVSFGDLNQQQVRFPSLKQPRDSSFSRSFQNTYKVSGFTTKISTASSARQQQKQHRNQSLGFTPKLKRVINVGSPMSSVKPYSKLKIKTFSSALNPHIKKTRNQPQSFTPKIKRLIKVASPISTIQASSKLKIQTFSKALNLIDWKTTPLETCILTNYDEFNIEQDTSLLTEYQIHAMQLEDLIHSHTAKNCLKTTVKRLCLDMLLDSSTVELLSDSQLLQYCKTLIKIRKSTLNLIKKIHEREYVMLRLITDSTCDKQNIESKFMKLTFQIISQIKTWKNFNISSSQFIYDGQNYMKKIHNDLVFLESSALSP